MFKVYRGLNPESINELFQFRETEAVVRMCSVKKLFLEISPNSQENTCARDSF